MKTLYTLFILTLVVLSTNVQADVRKKYIAKYKATAIEEMKKTGIPASISLAQGILESGNGMSELAVYANNHFGIKCHEWKGASYNMDDDAKDECFRKYKNADESWKDHSEFLTGRPRYAALFKLKKDDYKGWAKGLKAAGYATNPKYAELLIKIIEEEELYKYDTGKHIAADSQKETELEQESNVVAEGFSSRVEMRNGTKCIVVQEGDTYEQIASHFKVEKSKLLKYNESSAADLKANDVVYLNYKKTKIYSGSEYHVVQTGETLYSLSQKYGIKVKNLAKLNYFKITDSIVKGEKIYLTTKAKLY